MNVGLNPYPGLDPKVGRLLCEKTPGESYYAYVPAPLPPVLDMEALSPALEKATLALGALKHVSLPNSALFIYMYVRKEALLSSQIEGTQSSFSDLMLFESHQPTTVSTADVEEVSYYIKALTYGVTQIRGDFPLSLRLLRNIHGILLSGGRGATKLPGEFRRSQNWIGGTRPGNALFVPPPPLYLSQCLADFETFLHDERLPVLIKAGLAHVQFETIHPFLDGNGRLGRLLITLLLCAGNVLDEPILYLSLYLKKHRHLYYNLLQEVRIHGKWEVWLEFFLNGVTASATQVAQNVGVLTDLFDQDVRLIESLGRQRFSVEKIWQAMKQSPQVTVAFLVKQLDISAPTIREGLNTLVKIGILRTPDDQKRDKVYVYKRYLDILAEGTEPL